MAVIQKKVPYQLQFMIGQQAVASAYSIQDLQFAWTR